MTFKKGKLNPHWKGGTSQYPNADLMRKNRLIVLNAANWICRYCGKKATEVHHIDESKDKHAIDNLAACCEKCNHNPKRSSTKYKKLYGKTAKEIAKELKRSITTIHYWHKDGILSKILAGEKIGESMNKQNEDVVYKAFTTRRLRSDLHQRIKVLAALRGVNQEEMFNETLAVGLAIQEKAQAQTKGKRA